MKISSFHVLYSMKTKFATLIALFFLILSSQAEEQDVVHRYTAGADSFYRRTLSRIAEGWVGTRENFRFALQSLKDKAVTAEREAKARARLTYDNVRTETARKTRQIAMIRGKRSQKPEKKSATMFPHRSAKPETT